MCKITTGKLQYGHCTCGDPICTSYYLNHARSNGGLSKGDCELYCAAPKLLAALNSIFSDDQILLNLSDALGEKFVNDLGVKLNLLNKYL